MISINYKSKVEYQAIDIKKLRPHKSYDYLIENRNASLKELLANEERLKDFLNCRNCPVCSRNDYIFLYKKDSLDLVKCNHCMVVYVNPIFDEETYFKIYRSQQYQQIVKGLGEASHDYRKERFGKERMNVIEQYHDENLPKNLLDIGCSTGFLLEEARDRHWNAQGIELNPSAAEFAHNRNLQVFQIPLEEIQFDHKFSVITLYDVLEHLVSPSNIISKVNQLLTPGGKIYIYVPNYNSASRELLGIENAHFIWPTHHLTYFSPKSLKFFLERHGFNVFNWETQGLDMYDWQWYLNDKTDIDTKLLEEHLEQLQFYVNASGHGKNLRMYAEKGK